MNLPILLDSMLSGTLQGATELLPVSSTGHLLLLSTVLGLNLALSDIAVLHLGTLASIVIVFRENLKKLINRNVLIALAIAALPAGIVGFFLEDIIESSFNSPLTIALSLLIWGIAMIITDWWAKRHTFHTSSLENISLKQAAIVGIAQLCALIPGTSRSGITTIAGIAAGISPSTALAFSFLSGIPLLAGSGLYGVSKLATDNSTTSEYVGMILLATVISAVVGTVAALILKKTITKGILTMCGVYRIVMSGIIIAVVLW